MVFFGKEYTDIAWIKHQLEFLEHYHQYYTETAQNIRSYGKSMRIEDLRKKLAVAENENNE